MNRTQQKLRQTITFALTTTLTHLRELIGRSLPNPQSDRAREGPNFSRSFKGPIGNSNSSDMSEFSRKDWLYEVFQQGISQLKYPY